MSPQRPFEFSKGLTATATRYSVAAGPAGFEPKYGCVEPSDEWGGILACVALAVGRPLAIVRQVAQGRFNVPVNAQWRVVHRLAVDLLAHFGWTGAFCETYDSTSKIPDLAFAVTKASIGGADKSVQRCLLFHRQRPAPGQPGVEYFVDPFPGIPTAQRIRFDVQNVVLSHFMDVYWMQPDEDY